MVADLRRAPGLSVVLPTSSCQANKRTYQRTSKQREAPSRQQTNIPTYKQTARSALTPTNEHTNAQANSAKRPQALRGSPSKTSSSSCRGGCGSCLHRCRGFCRGRPCIQSPCCFGSAPPLSACCSERVRCRHPCRE